MKSTNALALIFTSKYCKASQQLLKKVIKLENEFQEFKFKYFEITDEFADYYNIEYVPTIILYNNGLEFKRIIGSVLIKPLRVVLKQFKECLNEKKI